LPPIGNRRLGQTEAREAGFFSLAVGFKPMAKTAVYARGQYILVNGYRG
jgi:hypothetical protein